MNVFLFSLRFFAQKKMKCYYVEVVEMVRGDMDRD